ncbi:MAG TPA: hypothetical protein VJ045_05690 [Hyphomicrobiaceae bacterium]|nr:hypothetical protein [Hyphomicrobiaceae bacterium]
MMILLLQIFLLLGAAFLLGAAVACLLRRVVFGRRSEKPAGATKTPMGIATESQTGPGGASAARFEQALSGAPMIEVQLLPKAPPRPSGPAAPRHPAVPGPPARAADSLVTAAPAPSPTPPGQTSDGAPIATEHAEAVAARRGSPPASAETAPAVASSLEAAKGPEPLAGDDLTRIRGVDAETRRGLNQLGVRRFADIADWTPSDVARMSQSLGFYGRIERENWIEQAQILAKGGETDFSRRRARGELDTQGSGAALAAADVTVSTAGTAPDRLHRIIGLDAETETLLITSGITRFAQIAGWTSADVEKVELLLGKPGRVGLENWIEQARVLSRAADGVETGAPRRGEDLRANGTKPAVTPASPPRSDLTGFRSVRSQALRGEMVGAIAGARGAFDDLKRIRGIGVLIEKKLNSLGVTTYEQIANWTGADAGRISQILDFKGRIERESWVEQARILASGGETEFSRRVDRGGVESSRVQRG